MNERELRRYRRYEMQEAVLFLIGKKTIPAIMKDISKRGIGVICDQEIAPETEVDISIEHIDDFIIHGTVKWVNSIQEGTKKNYRMGIEVDSVLVISEMDSQGFPERYKLIKDLFSELEINV